MAQRSGGNLEHPVHKADLVPQTFLACEAVTASNHPYELAIAPVVLDGGLGAYSDRATGPVGGGEEFRFQPAAEDGARHGNADFCGEGGALRVVNGGSGKLLADAVEGGDGMEGCAVVVALDGGKKVRGGANDRNACGLVAEGKDAGVLKEDDGLFGGP